MRAGGSICVSEGITGVIFEWAECRTDPGVDLGHNAGTWS
jgi:hypothetical protein